MNYEELKQILETYIFEYIERITRFYQHLNEVERQFYREEDINLRKIDNNVIFINSYKSCLIKLFYMAIGYNNALEKNIELEKLKKIINQVINNIEKINTFHKNYLVYLPRPKAPVELQRFSRIINKQIDNARSELHDVNDNNDNENREISIFVREITSEETDVPDSLSPFKSEEMEELIDEFNKNASLLNIQQLDKFELKSEYKTYHIHIPRIDASNPCRWPTLIHELAHHIFSLFFSGQNIDEDFKNKLDLTQKQILSSIESNNQINILNWLTECWCDLLATFIIGPAFWFSQISSFIMESNSIFEEHTLKTHPPALFRLKLIKRIIDHRIFENYKLDILEDEIVNMEKLIKYFDFQNDHFFENCHDIRQLFIFFKSYFFSYFFQKNNKKVTETLQPLVKYTFEIKADVVKRHIEDIRKERPIPSKSSQNNKNIIIEEPASVQDILLAAWLFRKSSLQTIILSNLNSISNLKDEKKLDNNFQKFILSEFNKFDQIILKSIQVSEWFDLYDPFIDPVKLSNDEINDLINKYESNIQDDLNFKLLTDTSIYNLLKSSKLKIIPIINLKDQLGTSSFDIRLGTSFQLYYPNKTGIVDFYR